jgi:hypothetical protein
VAGLLPMVAACSDDPEPVEAVTQEEYDAEAAFYTSDLVPRGRALIRRLADLGFPADKDAEYRAALGEALAVLATIEADPFDYIDERHRAETPPEEDLLNRLRAALDAADVPC